MGTQKFLKFFRKSHSAGNCRTVPKMSIPYLYTLPNTLGSCPKQKNCRQPIRIEHEKNLQLRQPIRIEYYVTRVVSQSESNTKKNLQLRQPIRIEYYVTRVVSQSESNITSPESSRLGWKTLRGSRRLAIAYLNTEGRPPSS